MSARERLQDMIRVERGDMNVYSQTEVRAALDELCIEVLREVYDAIEDPAQRKAVGGGLGWETARDVVHNLLRKTTGGAA